MAKLTDKHLADLRGSGLSDEQIERCGFCSLHSADEIKKALHWNGQKCDLGPCLKFPFYDAKGNLLDYCRLKPDVPRKAKENGKPIKYESPKGSSNLPFFPPGTRGALGDQSRPLLVTEGEKKAAAADQHDLACIGLVGVYGWQKKRTRGSDGKAIGERELIASLSSIPWQGRAVYVCFDSDAADNAHVQAAEWHLAKTLSQHGATVKIIRLPPANGAKVGLDDYLLANGPASFRKLMESATNPEPPRKILAPIEAAEDPHRLARLYLENHGRHADGLTLHHQLEQWKRWDGTAYRELPDGELRAELVKATKAEMDRVNLLAQQIAQQKGEPAPITRKITRGTIGNVEQALASLTMLPAAIEAPKWWDGTGWRSRNLIAMSNGLLDLDAVFNGGDYLIPHTPRWFSPVCLPYPFQPEANCERWLAFLERNLEGDRERIALLQEWFGLCLTPDTSRQKFLVLEGEGGNGKSVVCTVLECVLGSDNCSHVALEMFAEKFHLASTLGKLANIASEVGEIDKAAEGVLKCFTSGDPMQFDRKHKPAFSAVPTARLIIATNNRPRFTDRSDGIWRRMILMPFRVTIAENDPDRVHGMDKPEWWEASGELPGIFLWSLVGLACLNENKRFTRSQLCEQGLADYRKQSNPARTFLTENCRDDDPTAGVVCQSLYKKYCDWCTDRGYRHLADHSFGREVKREFRRVERRQVSRIWTYCGLSLNDLIA
jgi:putative DNA primase/helicase